jgi:hypothetical protein
MTDSACSKSTVPADRARDNLEPTETVSVGAADTVSDVKAGVE